MYQVVIILKALNEIALMALISQGALYILAGSRRDSNVVYFILKTLTLPVMKLARWITPRVVLDQHIGWVALFMLLLAEVLLIVAKINFHLQAAGG
jgi:NADH:ubiquinone oxidoreductase subunit H